jgi:IS5 family transposase
MQVAELLHGGKNTVYGDAGYTAIEKREAHENRKVIWQIAARRSTYSKLNKSSLLYKPRRKIEHLFRVIKQQFGYVKVRFYGPMKTRPS